MWSEGRDKERSHRVEERREWSYRAVAVRWKGRVATGRKEDRGR